MKSRYVASSYFVLAIYVSMHDTIDDFRFSFFVFRRRRNNFGLSSNRSSSQVTVRLIRLKF